MPKLKEGDICYFVANAFLIKKCCVRKVMGEFIMIITDDGKILNLRRSRPYLTREEADAHRRKPPRKNPYDYMY